MSLGVLTSLLIAVIVISLIGRQCLTAEGNCVLPNGSVFTILRAMSSTVLCTGVTNLKKATLAFRNVIF